MLMMMERPGVWAGGFRAWDARGRLPGHRPRREHRAHAPGAVGGARRAGRRTWFPFGVHLIEGFFQTVRSMDALSRQRESLVALGHAGRRARPRDQQPGVGRDAGGRRAAGDAATRCCRRSRSSPSAAITAEQFIALDALRREIDPSAAGWSTRSRSPTARRRSATGSTSTASTTRGSSPRRSRPPASTPAWCERVAAGARRATPSDPALEWVAGTLSSAALLARDQGVDRADLRARSAR